MIKLPAEAIYTLFVHRKDVFAEQMSSGIYIPIKRPITILDIREHIKGEKTLGVYCLNTDNTIRWVCIDLDGDDLAELDLISKVIYDNIEGPKMREFSGRRGYHVWFFFNPPILADLGKRIILSRLHKLTGLGKYELFPKQTSLDPGRLYGNLVKLPLAKHRVSGKFSEILQMEGIQFV